MDNKIGIMQWCLPELDEHCFPILREAGLEAVQPELSNGALVFPLSDPEVQKAYLEESRKQGLDLLPLAANALCTYGFVGGLETPDGIKAVRILDEAVDIAAAMGLEGITIPNFGENRIQNPAHYENTVLALRHTCERALEKGILVYTENVLPAEDVTRLFKECGFANLRLLFDSQNYWRAGLSYTVDVLKAHYDRIGSHLHVKDGPDEVNAPLGEGGGPVLDVLRIVKERAFSGAIVLENNYLDPPLFSEDLAGVKRDAAFVREHLK